MSKQGDGSSPYVVELRDISLRYGKTLALDQLNLNFPVHKSTALIGPDGVGKSSLLSLLTGAHAIQDGSVTTLGGDMSLKSHRDKVCHRIAYMPQGLGKNLYPTLSIEENLQFFARMFGHDKDERRRRIDLLTESTGLHSFLDRPAGKLSGGMKQKLGLCCALIHDPDLLILDEPTTGVDPLARAQFWELIDKIRSSRPGMSVIAATAYMDEAQNFDWIVAMNAGQVLAKGTAKELLSNTKSTSLEEAFIHLLPEELTKNYKPVEIPPLEEGEEKIAIEAQSLTKKFGNFTAVNNVSFRIKKGEIFGFLGSNGCGKSTTMKMLTGLLPATEGKVWLFGKEVDPEDISVRNRLGYMSQAFSLYSELTVRQNLVLHARLFNLKEEDIPQRVVEVEERFGLAHMSDILPANLPLGQRQRLSLAVAVIHRPEILILDEPTSGVDPVARDEFWRMLITLSRRDKVTIFISTHFMNEAMRCDRMSMMHAGQVLDSDTPEALTQKRKASSLEEAFISYLIEAGAGTEDETGDIPPPEELAPEEQRQKENKLFSFDRFYSCMWRETLELYRDPIRLTLALLGSMILMLVMGYGITMDVEDLRFAVLDNDQSILSNNYTLNLSGSRYFTEKEKLYSYDELDKRMRSGEITMAIEMPPNFARDVDRGSPVEVGVWIDGANPQRAETIRGYVVAMHQLWLEEIAKTRFGHKSDPLASIEVRYRYNPNVTSLPAMVPAVIPLLLLMIPAMLATLSVVREKEMGSILNLYTTPMTKSEFILGKQTPYVLISMISFLLMAVMAIFLFDVPIKGSLLTLFFATFIYCGIATGLGMLISALTKSQIVAMFGTIVLTMVPAVQFSGLINTVASLQGGGRLVGEVFPTTHMLIITRGIFNKALGFGDLYQAINALLITLPIIVALSIFFLKKQDS